MRKTQDIIPGQKWNKLTAIRFIKSTTKYGHIWLWKCECGVEKEILVHSVKIGNTKSCGCFKNKYGIKHYCWVGFGEISGNFFGAIKRGASKRKLDFTITVKEIWNLFLKQNRKCAISGVDIYFAPALKKNRATGTCSLDRIDSSKGYTIDNVQWVHKWVNNMKQDMTDEEFINWCKIIAKNN